MENIVYYLYFWRGKPYIIGEALTPWLMSSDYLLFDSHKACLDYLVKEGVIDGTSCI